MTSPSYCEKRMRKQCVIRLKIIYVTQIRESVKLHQKRVKIMNKTKII